MTMLLSGRQGTLWGLSGFFDARRRAETSGILMAGPHRGSKMATSSIPGLLASLASLPLEILSHARAALEPDVAPYLKVDVSKQITSILSPRPE